MMPPPPYIYHYSMLVFCFVCFSGLRIFERRAGAYFAYAATFRAAREPRRAMLSLCAVMAIELYIYLFPVAEDTMRAA